MLRSIKSKIVVFAVMATLVPSLGLGLLSFRQNEAQISDNVTRELRALTNYAIREIELWIEKRVHETQVTSASIVVVEALATAARLTKGPAKNPAAVGHYLRSVQEKLDAIRELTVVNIAGEVVASSAETPAPVVIPDNWPEKRVIAAPHWDKQYDAPTLSIAVPVLSYGDVLIGAVVAVLDLRNLKPHMKSATKSPPGEVLLVDSDGRTLVSSNSDENSLVQLDPALLSRLRAQTGDSMAFRGLTHQQVIGLADVAAELSITVLAERDRAEVYGAWIELRNIFLALVGALVLVVTAIAFQMGRSIVLPLQRLMRAADRIAAGDLDVRLSATRNDELGHLTQVFNQMTERITAAHEAMRQQNEVLKTLSITDSLTGLYNRSKLDSILSDQLARFKRSHRPFTLLMLDIDHFKTLNDTYGHVTGDEILAAVAGILLQSIRSIDYAARYGGDEFIIILTETSAKLAWKTAERVRSQVEALHPTVKGVEIALTVSLGIVESLPEDMSATEVFARADHALYEAKRGGRNRAYSPLLANSGI